MIRYRYVMEVQPPAPYVHVVLQHPTEPRATSELLALVDSGADRSVVPLEVAHSLSLTQTGEIWAMGLGNELVSLPTFGLQIAIRHQRPVLANAFAHANEKHVLLGRDVLNQFTVRLLGPQLAIEIE